MEDNRFVHKDFVPQPVQTPDGEDIQKKELTRRTLITALITAAVTFILTAALVIMVGMPLLLLEDTDNQGGAYLEFSDDEETIEAVDKLSEIIALLKNQYYLELTDKEIIEAISAGLPSAIGSPYTYYLTTEQNEAIQESMSGEYVGIGCTVAQNKYGETEIVEVYSGSPAEKGGLQTGDVIMKVNGQDVSQAVDIIEVAAKVKGEEGTPVTIEIYRGMDNSTFEVKLIRKTITVHNVSHRMLEGDIGYVHVKGFVNGVETDFSQAIDSLVDQGAKDIVIDLRYNSGGSAAVMLNMLDHLLPKDTLLATIKGRENGEEFTVSWKTEDDPAVPDEMRYAILVNSYSASASEFFSGCLRDHGKAVIIGETTFGKGSGTATYDLDDGSAVNITIFQYFLPGGDAVEGIGLAPDHEVVLPDELRYLAIEAIPEEEDTVLQKALEELQR
jgi:carboxyl-terminal processing protease